MGAHHPVGLGSFPLEISHVVFTCFHQTTWFQHFVVLVVARSPEEKYMSFNGLLQGFVSHKWSFQHMNHEV